MAGIVRILVIAARRAGPHNGRVSRRIVFVDLPGHHRARPRRAARGVHRRGRGRAPDRAASADAYRVEVAAPRRRGRARPPAGRSIVADRALRVGARARSTRWSSSGGEGARAAADDPSSSRGVRRARAPEPAGRVGVHRRVRARGRRACSTAGARPRTGRGATSFARAYPDVTVDPDPIFVRDGNVWTSAGVTAGMDLALALVDDDLGRDVALMTAAPARAVRAATRWSVAVQRAARCAARGARAAARSAAVDRRASRRRPQRRAARGACRDEPAPLRARVPRRGRLHAGRLRRAGAGRGRAPAARDDRLRASTRSRARPASAPPRRCAARSPRRVGASPSEYRDRFRPSRAS